jgi:hypothetical protein
MISTLDILRTAHIVLKRYGWEAPLIAARRIGALLGLGDVDGHLVWKQIVAAVEELRRTERRPGEAVN